MTKVIHVLRHSQSVGKQPGERDYDRPLTQEGRVLADAAGRDLKSVQKPVELILGSAAIRSAETVHIINRALQLPETKIHLRPDLYEALMLNWMDLIHVLPEECSCVLLVGHNPWLSLLASEFEGSTIDLAPCERITFEFNKLSWKEIKGKGKRTHRFNPA